MNEVLFVEKREPDWQRLTQLCDRADASPVNLRGEELKEFLRLYRRVSRDLGFARTKTTNLDLILFLNDLCARAYAIVYRPRTAGLGQAFGQALALAARTVRKRAASVWISAAMFVGFAVFAYLCLEFAPQTREHFIPKELEQTFEHWRSGDMEARTAAESFAATLFYGGHNPLVSIFDGALAAATFGIGTVQLAFLNGSVLGALVHELQPVGRVGYLFVHISPHGVTELSGAMLSGAAGLVLAAALIAPGRRKRGEALKEAGQDAIVLLGSAIVMMFIAAPIEGYFSFHPGVPDAAKIAFAIGSAIAWGAFWLGFGRRSEDPELAGSSR